MFTVLAGFFVAFNVLMVGGAIVLGLMERRVAVADRAKDK